MIKSLTKIKKHKRLTLIVLVGAVLLSFLSIILSISARDEPSGIVNTSSQNIEITQHAVAKRDAKFCDEIKGGISATHNNENKKSNNGLQGGVSAEYPDMDESKARQACRDRVRSLIDRSIYEKEICSAGNVSHYDFDNVRWPCPSED